MEKKAKSLKVVKSEVAKPVRKTRTVTQKKLTAFGKELQKLRIDRDETRAQMAKSLKIADRELAMIEFGATTPSYSFPKQVVQAYKLEDSAADSMVSSYQQSVSRVTIETKYLDPEKIEILYQLLESAEIAKMEAEQPAKRKKVKEEPSVVEDEDDGIFEAEEKPVKAAKSAKAEKATPAKVEKPVAKAAKAVEVDDDDDSLFDDLDLDEED